jgi:hypothetical protein
MTQQNTLPSKLYKYRDVGEFTEAIFDSGTLFFSPPSKFNDPFDCGFYVAVSGSDNEQVVECVAWGQVTEKFPSMTLADKREATQQVRKELLARHRSDLEDIAIKMLEKETTDQVRICCFSEVRDDILMWSHYSDYHRGICLEFSPTEGFLREAQPVNYSDKYPSLDLISVVKDEDLRAAAPWMCQKAEQWIYEKEWRVLDFDGGTGKKLLPPCCLTGVILGCKISDPDKAKVDRWIEAWPSPITVYQATQSKTSFQLKIDEVS